MLGNQESLLTRLSSASYSEVPALTATQASIDQAVTTFSHEITNWRNIAAMSVGSATFSFARVGLEGLGLTRIIGAPLAGLANRTLALGAEVTAFRGTTNLLQNPTSAEQAVFHRQGWASSFIDFALLKGAGRVFEGQNVILTHLGQSGSMVAGHQLGYSLGLATQPEGSLFEQLAHAEVTNLAMGFGNSIFGMATGNRMQAIERALHLQSHASHELTLSQFNRDFTEHTALNPALQLAGVGRFLGERRTSESIVDQIRNGLIMAMSMNTEGPEGGAPQSSVKGNGENGLVHQPAYRQSLDRLTPVEPQTPPETRSQRIISYVLARTLSGIGGKLRRLLVKDIPESPYRYEFAKTANRYRLSHDPLRPLTSAEGRQAYHEANAEALEQMSLFVEQQVGLAEGSTRTQYESARDAMIRLNQETQSAWDVVIEALRAHPTQVSFAEISKAFWSRDQLIRQHPELKQMGVGPREFDLIIQRRQFDIADAENQANAQLRMRTLLGEYSYVHDKICSEYNALAAQTPNPDRPHIHEQRMKNLQTLRFETETVYMKAARDGLKSLSIEQHQLLQRTRETYLGFLNLAFTDSSYGEINAAHQMARVVYERHSEEQHERNLALAPLQLERFNTEQRAIHQMDQIEARWQVARYTQLIEWSRVNSRAINPLALKTRLEAHAAIARYRDAVKDYEKYSAGLLQQKGNDPERNALHRAVFVRLRELHDTVKLYMQRSRVEGADDLQMLSFTFKVQAQFLRREKRGMDGLKPLLESTLSMDPALKAQEQGIYSHVDLHQLSGREWGANLINQYARHANIFGVGQLLGFYMQEFRPEMTQVAGMMNTLPPESTELNREDFAHRGGILNSMHLGQFEFPVTFGIPYVTGLPHAAILAQEGVKAFPVVGPFLSGITRRDAKGRKQFHIGSGAYTSRSSKTQQHLENFVLASQAYMGNLMNIYGNGTRDIANPTTSPYADLNTHPEALHLPGYHPSRYAKGMTVKLAQETGVPVIPVAYDLDNIYCEPSMPMPSEFSLGKFIRSPRKVIKQYAGFWERSTMFPYVRPGQDGFNIAYGNPVTPESFIRESDLRTMPSYKLQMEQLDNLEAPARAEAVKRILYQLNFALIRDEEARAGYIASMTPVSPLTPNALSSPSGNILEPVNSAQGLLSLDGSKMEDTVHIPPRNPFDAE